MNCFSRRSFLGTGAGALSAAALPVAEAAESTGFKLGVASYSFRKFPRDQAIAMTKQLGLRYINIKDFHLPLNSTPEQIKAARSEFEDAGLTILGGGNISMQKDDEAELRSRFEYAKLAGMPLMVCAPTAVTLPKLERYVKEYDIKIAVHNHGPEDKNFPTPQSVLKIVKDMDPRCGLCIDIGHTARTGVDVVESIAEAGPRLLDMHAKDLRNLRDAKSQCDVGDGAMPIVGIFKQLMKMKYQGGVMLEYEINAENPLPGMQKSFAYMRGVAAALTA